MKYLIAGLGNIGSEYENTRHNIGFKVLDEIAKQESFSFKTDRLAAVAEFKYKGRTLILIKPITYMNLSGNAIRFWLQAEKISIENLLVVTDDIALPFGKIRIKGKGSDGGHNGLKHIQEILQTHQYARLRFGVGNEYAKGKQVDYVLGEWSAEEKEALIERLNLSSDIIKSFILAGLNNTMNLFNGK
jgi:PTH1 family peptidyl-tRNA hydrolase